MASPLIFEANWLLFGTRLLWEIVFAFIAAVQSRHIVYWLITVLSASEHCVKVVLNSVVETCLVTLGCILFRWTPTLVTHRTSVLVTLTVASYYRVGMLAWTVWWINPFPLRLVAHLCVCFRHLQGFLVQVDRAFFDNVADTAKSDHISCSQDDSLDAHKR